MYSKKPLLGENSPFADLLQEMVGGMLEGETEDVATAERAAGRQNKRNEKLSRGVPSSTGPLPIRTPRDRNGDFEPELIGKRQRELSNCATGEITYIQNDGPDRIFHRELDGTYTVQGYTIASAWEGFIDHSFGSYSEFHSSMQMSAIGLDMLTGFESFRSEVYRVTENGNPTIGFGHELLPGEKFSDGITRKQAYELLNNDLKSVYGSINRYVSVPLSQNNYDALASYVFNVGAGNAFVSNGVTRNLLRNLNNGDYVGAASEMDIIRSGGEILPGLQSRRQAEQNLFLCGHY